MSSELLGSARWMQVPAEKNARAGSMAAPRNSNLRKTSFVMTTSSLFQSLFQMYGLFETVQVRTKSRDGLLWAGKLALPSYSASRVTRLYVNRALVYVWEGCETLVQTFLNMYIIHTFFVFKLRCQTLQFLGFYLFCICTDVYSDVYSELLCEPIFGMDLFDWKNLLKLVTFLPLPNYANLILLDCCKTECVNVGQEKYWMILFIVWINCEVASIPIY